MPSSLCPVTSVLKMRCQGCKPQTTMETPGTLNDTEIIKSITYKKQKKKTMPAGFGEIKVLM